MHSKGRNTHRLSWPFYFIWKSRTWPRNRLRSLTSDSVAWTYKSRTKSPRNTKSRNNGTIFKVKMSSSPRLLIVKVYNISTKWERLWTWKLVADGACATNCHSLWSLVISYTRAVATRLVSVVLLCCCCNGVSVDTVDKMCCDVLGGITVAGQSGVPVLCVLSNLSAE